MLVIYYLKDFLFERSRDIEAVALVNRIYEVNQAVGFKELQPIYEVAFFLGNIFVFISVVLLNSFNHSFNYLLVLIPLVFVPKFGFKFVVKGYENYGKGEGFVLDIP